MRARVAFGFLLLFLVSCGDDGAEPGDGGGAGASAGSGGVPSGAGGAAAGAAGTAQSGSGNARAGSGGQNGVGPGGAGASAGSTAPGGAGSSGVGGAAGEGVTSGGRAGESSSSGTGGGGEPFVNPTLTALEPSTLPIGSGAFELVLRGSDFRTDHVVSFDGNVFPTTFISSEELRAEVPGIALGGRARSVNVLALRVADPALRSNILMFQVTDREP